MIHKLTGLNLMAVIADQKQNEIRGTFCVKVNESYHQYLNVNKTARYVLLQES